MLLKSTRKAVDLTQEQIAPLVHISRSTVSKLERGEMPLKAEDLVKWLQIVGSRMNPSNATLPIEVGIAMVHSVDILMLTETLTKLVGGMILWI
ncbi:helix-turn-helix domain-containing protein [Sporosarcina sp. FSL K6-1508]|uniref:helix-turn-helix domain-containing protein n=1 Tax=Sporosarcina sp. FSL K6-1508 TaxID=2921553 RepID=UPI0030F9346E